MNCLWRPTSGTGIEQVLTSFPVGRCSFITPWFTVHSVFVATLTWKARQIVGLWQPISGIGIPRTVSSIMSAAGWNLSTNYKHVMRPGPYEIPLKIFEQCKCWDLNAPMIYLFLTTDIWIILVKVKLFSLKVLTCRSIKYCLTSIEHNKTKTTDKRVRILKLVCLLFELLSLISL